MPVTRAEIRKLSRDANRLVDFLTTFPGSPVMAVMTGTAIADVVRALTMNAETLATAAERDGDRVVEGILVELTNLVCELFGFEAVESLSKPGGMWGFGSEGHKRWNADKESWEKNRESLVKALTSLEDRLLAAQGTDGTSHPKEARANSGAKDAIRPSERDGFIPAAEIIKRFSDIAPDHKALDRILQANPSIRFEKPSKRRKNVNVNDFLKFASQQKQSKPSDNQAGIQYRYEQERAKKDQQ